MKSDITGKYFTLWYSQSMQKRDLRKLNETERQKVRDSVKQVIRKTNNIAKTARILGVSRQTIYNWLRPVREGKQLENKKQGRRRELTGTQCLKLEKLISSNSPDFLNLPFALWSPKAIKMLIEKKYSKSLSYETIGRLIKEWGFVPDNLPKFYLSDDATCPYLQEMNTTMSEFIKANKAQAYYLGICERPEWSDYMGRQNLYAFTKKGHVKFMCVKWNKYIRSRYDFEDKREILVNFVEKLKQKSRKKLIIFFIEGTFRKYVSTFNWTGFLPKGISAYRIVKEKGIFL